jgi:hypothetical protein
MEIMVPAQDTKFWRHLTEFHARIAAIIADPVFFRGQTVHFLSLDIVDTDLPVYLLTDQMIACLQARFPQWEIGTERISLIIRFIFIRRPLESSVNTT